MTFSLALYILYGVKVASSCSQNIIEPSLIPLKFSASWFRVHFMVWFYPGSKNNFSERVLNVSLHCNLQIFAICFRKYNSSVHLEFIEIYIKLIRITKQFDFRMLDCSAASTIKNIKYLRTDPIRVYPELWSTPLRL